MLIPMDADGGVAPEGAASDPVSDSPREPPPTTSMIQAVDRRRWTRGLVWGAAALVVLTLLGFAAATLGDALAG